MKKTATFFVLLFLLVPSLSFASFDVSVKYGSKGPAVSEVQDFLTDQGFLKGTVDGKFGFATLRAVKAFQTANNLTPDGYFGKASRTAAQSILADLTQGSDAEETADTGTVSAPVVQPAPPKPVSDTGTQTQIAALAQQVQAQQATLNAIASSTQIVAQNTAPIVVPPLPSLIATPLVAPEVCNDTPTMTVTPWTRTTNDSVNDSNIVQRGEFYVVRKGGSLIPDVTDNLYVRTQISSTCTTNWTVSITTNGQPVIQNIYGSSFTEPNESISGVSSGQSSTDFPITITAVDRGGHYSNPIIQNETVNVEEVTNFGLPSYLTSTVAQCESQIPSLNQQVQSLLSNASIIAFGRDAVIAEGNAQEAITLENQIQNIKNSCEQ